jgi:hypothetical protein
MKSKTKKPTARQKAVAEALWASDDMKNLSDLAGKLIQVPKTELDERLEDEKRQRTRSENK